MNVRRKIGIQAFNKKEAVLTKRSGYFNQANLHLDSIQIKQILSTIKIRMCGQKLFTENVE